jgi:hypothetical protein
MKTTAILLASTAIAAMFSTPARAGAADPTAIQAALKQLDPKDDNQWTADGLPRIDAVRTLVGDQTISREDVNAAALGFNREAAGGENRPGTPPVAPAAPSGTTDPMAAAEADGWIKHPDTEGYHYKGTDVVADADLVVRYGASFGTEGGQSAPSGGGQTAEQPSDQAQDISAQTGMGGAMTARSPEPVEGELRKTHVSLPSDGEPGERPIGVTQGMTDAGVNQLGTPEGPVQNAGRALELSGEVAARSAGSTMTPSHAPADGSNTPSISLGGAADPAVEAAAPGGAVIAEGADPATFFEGKTAGGPFGNSGITAGAPELASLDNDFAGDPDAVAAAEKELEQAEARTAELRGQVDDLSAQLHTSLRTEAQIRRYIEANRPRSGTMDTIQAFLRSSKERHASTARAAKDAPKPRPVPSAPPIG